MKCMVTESFLKRWGHRYRYDPEVRLADIQLTDQTLHNIRVGGLNQDRVVQYGIAMTEGAEFPPLVLAPVGNGKYEPLGGCHRVEGAKLAERKSFDAYILELRRPNDARAIEVLQRVLNTTNGEAYTHDERMLQAVRIVALGYTVADAAKMMLIKGTALSNRIAYNEVQARIKAAGIRMIDDRFVETSLVELHRIKNPEAFAAALALAQSARFTTQQVKDLSKEIRDQRTDSDAMKVVGVWRDRMDSVIKETANGKFMGPTSPARRSLAYLDRLARAVRVEMFTTCSPVERRAVIKQVKAAIARLQRLLDVLQQADRKKAA